MNKASINIIGVFCGVINWIVLLLVLIYSNLSKDFNLNGISDKITLGYLIISFIFPISSLILMKRNSGIIKKLLNSINIVYLILYLLGILIVLHAMFTE